MSGQRDQFEKFFESITLVTAIVGLIAPPEVSHVAAEFRLAAQEALLVVVYFSSLSSDEFASKRNVLHEEIPKRMTGLIVEVRTLMRLDIDGRDDEVKLLYRKRIRPDRKSSDKSGANGANEETRLDTDQSA